MGNEREITARLAEAARAYLECDERCAAQEKELREALAAYDAMPKTPVVTGMASTTFSCMHGTFSNPCAICCGMFTEAEQSQRGGDQFNDWRLYEALWAIKQALQEPVNSYWPARKFLDQCDVYHGDLHDLNVLHKVAEVALQAHPPAPAPLDEQLQGYANDMKKLREKPAPAVAQEPPFTELEIARHKCGCEVCSMTAELCPATISSILMEREDYRREEAEEAVATPREAGKEE